MNERKVLLDCWRQAGLPDRHLNVMPSNTRKKAKFLYIFHTSQEKLQIHVMTILPTGMSGTYGINLVQCEIF